MATLSLYLGSRKTELWSAIYPGCFISSRDSFLGVLGSVRLRAGRHHTWVPLRPVYPAAQGRRLVSQERASQGPLRPLRPLWGHILISLPRASWWSRACAGWPGMARAGVGAGGRQEMTYTTGGVHQISRGVRYSRTQAFHCREKNKGNTKMERDQTNLNPTAWIQMEAIDRNP